MNIATEEQLQNDSVSGFNIVCLENKNDIEALIQDYGPDYLVSVFNNPDESEVCLSNLNYFLSDESFPFFVGFQEL